MNDVNRREIYRYLGYRGRTPDAAVTEAVEDCLEELRRTVTPRSVFRRYEIERIEEPSACGQNPEAGESERDLETGPLPEQGIGIHPHPHPQLLQIAGMTIRSTSLSVNLRATG